MPLHRLQSFFADTPYELIRDLEVHYQNVLFIVFRSCKFLRERGISHIRRPGGSRTANRPLHLRDGISNWKVSAEEALQQIKRNITPDHFEAGFPTVVQIGINFDNNTRRNIEMDRGINLIKKVP